MMVSSSRCPSTAVTFGDIADAGVGELAGEGTGAAAGVGVTEGLCALTFLVPAAAEINSEISNSSPVILFCFIIFIIRAMGAYVSAHDVKLNHHGYRAA